MKTLLFLTLTFSLSTAFSLGQDRGNGGDALVCYTNATRSQITSVKMFDYWEQEQVLKYGPVTLGAPQVTIQEKIEVATKRLSKFDPYLGGQIRQMALNLANNIQNYLVTSYELPEIDDANPRAIPTQPNCYIEQFAVQYKDLVTGQRRFSIADKFYNHPSADNDTRVGIILHEALYRYAIHLNPALSTSDDVRYLNYIIGSTLLDSLTLQDIEQFHGILLKSKIAQAACTQKFGLFLKLEPGREATIGSTCYNQIMNPKPNIYIELNQGTEFQDFVMIPSPSGSGTTYTPSRGITLYQKDMNSQIFVHLFYSGVKKRFSTRKVSLTDEYLSLDSLDSSNTNVTKEAIQGPGGKTFSCQTDLKFDPATLALISCHIQEDQVVMGSQSFFLGGYLRQLTANRWIIDSGRFFSKFSTNSQLRFNLLGSTKSFITFTRGQLPDSNTECTSDWMTVDDNYNVVAGCLKSEQAMEINGKSVGVMNDFEVQWIKGKYFLKGQLVYNKNGQGIQSPLFKNLRLVKTSSDEKFNYCGTLDVPSNKTWVTRSETVYIGYPGESFYDISTDNVVYKSDENVSIVTRLSCQKTDFLSDSY